MCVRACVCVREGGRGMENNEMKPMKLKKGFWKPEEDMILKRYVEAHGEGNWATISQKSGLTRGAKSCRLRWKNYLRPNIKHGRMSQDEVDLIIRMHKLLGNRWSLIAGRLPGRTDNEVKNYWNTHLNKKSRQQTQHNGTASAAITAATTNTDRNQDRTKDPAHTPTRKAHNQVWDKKTENTKILAKEPAWMELDEQSFLRRADTGYFPSMPGYINNACSGTLLTCDNEEQMASLTTTDVSVSCDAFGCHWEETYLDDYMQLWDDLK